MKFSLDSTLLSEKLGHVQGISERRSTMPILSHTLIEAGTEGLRITATDLDTIIIIAFGADVQDPGSIALPSKKLYEIVRELPQGKVEFEEMNNHWVGIRSLNSSFKIAGLPGDDFPEVKARDSVDMFPINSEVMEDMISKTIFAVTPDELRRNLSGIYFEQDGSTLRLIATDGHRLSLAQRSDVGELSLAGNFLVPKKGVGELSKILRSYESVKMGCSGTDFFTESDGVLLIVRLIEAEFPDYKQVIPETTKSSLSIVRVELLSAIRRVSLLSSEKTRSVKFSIEPGKLVLSSVSPEVGEAREEISITYDGDPIEIGFNSKYVIEAIEQTDTDTLTIALTDELSPVVIKPEGDDSYLAVIMPMRV